MTLDQARTIVDRLRSEQAEYIGGESNERMTLNGQFTKDEIMAIALCMQAGEF